MNYPHLPKYSENVYFKNQVTLIVYYNLHLFNINILFKGGCPYIALEYVQLAY